ncbi:MAG: NAD-dependent epimerase/dehydratase family protein [Pseudomonadota bacterium]
MKLLITGAGGYLGRHVTAAALRAGHEVRGSVRQSSQFASLASALSAPADRFAPVSLDLLRDEGWSAAMDGIDGVLHTASPVPTSSPASDTEILRPAIDGTERVLSAAARAGVARVVVTSSIAAILGAPSKGAGDTFGPDDWTDPDAKQTRAYAKAKTRAELLARDIAANTPGMRLSTVNPGYIFGPPLGGPVTSSLTLIDMLLRGRIPVLPRLAFPSVDVRDVAAAHLAALHAPAGSRFIASGPTLWLSEIAECVRAAVPSARVPRVIAPDWSIRLAARLVPSLAMIAGDVGRMKFTDPAACEALLGRPLSDPRQAVSAAAVSLAQRP